MDTRKLFLWVDIGLIIAIAISAILLGVMVTQGPAPVKVPDGVPYNVVYLSPTEIEVEFGNFSSPINFSDLIIEVRSPNGDASKADVINSILEYTQASTMHSLSKIEVSSTGLMEKGTSFILTNYKNLQTGAWAFKMTYRSTGQQIAGGTIIVPDIDTTPTGSFSGLSIISANEARVGFNSITPSTEFTFCYLEAWGPNMTTSTFYLNDTTSMSFQMEDGTVLSVIDSNNDGLINPSDYVSLHTDGKELSKGQWSIEIKYTFTKEKIATTVFNIR
jgi:hypothetical protein